MPHDRAPAAQAAYLAAQAAEQAGDLPGAQAQMEYAQRLAPGDGEITLAIGALRLAQHDPRASEPFELLARRDNIRAAWTGLAVVRRMAGFPDMALQELDHALQHFAPQPDMADFSDALARELEMPGWCGVSGDGVLLVALVGAADPAGLAIMLDAAKLVPPTPRARRKAPAHTRIILPLPEGWRLGRTLSVSRDGVPLIGSPVQLGAIARVEGFVGATPDGGLAGWLWQPADPDLHPEITIRPVAGRAVAGRAVGRKTLKLRATALAEQVRHPQPLAAPRGFVVPQAALAGLPGRLAVLGPDSRPLYGSPIDPMMELRSAAAAAGMVRQMFPAGPASARRAIQVEMPAVPADVIGLPPTARPPRRRGVDIVVPVYRGHAETMACIASVLESLAGPNAQPDARIVVVEDASPDAALVAELQGLARQKRIVLLRQPANRGFPGTANNGMRHSAARDVVLLNSDTLCPPGWLARLQAACFSAPDIGSVTPLSNDATVLSYPSVDAVNRIPDLPATQLLDGLAWAANGAETIDIPTAIGFCMYIRRECLDATGLLREDVFGQGYGEENDWCLRARHLGWRHVAASGVFVAHVGGQSFGAAKGHLIARNLHVLNRLHPGYAELITRFIAHDPVAPARRRIDMLRWRAAALPGAPAGKAAPRRRKPGPAVVLVTHGRDGGVKRRVRERCAELRAAGQRPIVLSPDRSPQGGLVCRVDDGVGQDYPNLRFAMPEEFPALLALLRAARPALVELHHFIGHHPDIAGLGAQLGVPQDVVVHDYSWFCPRINLVGAGRHYCGEPDLPGCTACIADLGSALDEEITPAALIARSAAVLGAARQVVVPAADVARRITRHFPALGLRPDILPWEDDAAMDPALSIPALPAGSPTRVCVTGAIGIEKGFELLLACARDAVARALPLEFVLVGHSCDDARLLATGVVQITGPYQEDEAPALIRALRPDIGWLPSLWPETWCYVLGLMWRAGLPVLAFALGAPADRIRASRLGWVVPPGLSPQMINTALLQSARQYRAEATPVLVP